MIISVTSAKDIRLPALGSGRDRYRGSYAASRYPELDRQAQADAELAAQIGVPYYPPGTWIT